MGNLYYGAKETPPKGKKPATMKQSIQAKQVRRYGRYKIDSRVAQLKGGPTMKQRIDKSLQKIATLQGRRTRLKREFGMAKISEADKDRLRKEFTKATRELKAEKAKLKKLVDRT